MKKPSPSRWLMQQKKQAQSWIRLCILLGIVSAGLLILQLHFLARIIDGVFLHGLSLLSIQSALYSFIALILFRGGLAWLKDITGFQAAAKIRQNIRMQIFAKLEALGPILSQQKRSGEWISSALEQIEALQGFFAQYLPQMSLCVIVPLMIVGVVFTLNWPAGLLLLITAPLIPLFMAL
ncbi:MAG: ABC transporter transmembrane domain-containing protein, partial [Gammaproteobacteria bacterium]|nr:ABC transporter transmembrane domain-containing protein [Gammaproteobacteria bacterium]